MPELPIVGRMMHMPVLSVVFEAVFEKGGEADFWLIKYNRAEELGYDGLRKEYAPYANFEAWKNVISLLAIRAWCLIMRRCRSALIIC